MDQRPRTADVSFRGLSRNSNAGDCRVRGGLMGVARTKVAAAHLARIGTKGQD